MVSITMQSMKGDGMRWGGRKNSPQGEFEEVASLLRSTRCDGPIERGTSHEAHEALQAGD